MAENSENKKSVAKTRNFIHELVETDISEGKNNGRVHTRFPPEPNGYLHIGHAKAICLDFGTAEKFGGKCNLRFDDTNPTKEDVEFVDSIKEDIKWLGYDWEDRLYYASDFFDDLYEFAVKLIKEGKAYIDDQPSELISEQRGTPQKPGVESPFRNRPVEENLDLFRRMKEGEFENGAKVLRAKIDMASPNMHMRDPLMYRISHVTHHRTGDKWCIYPMYDFAHGQCDYLEGVTHSLCTLEFEIHRPLYNWFVDQMATDDYRPRQIEFSRLNLTYTMMSKRKLLQLVEEGYVKSWDDPRMPTLSGMRRRGFTPASIRNLIEKVGITKTEGMIDVALLEHGVREDLNKSAQRVMGVLNPLKVVITNYPEDKVEMVQAINNPEDESAGRRDVPFTRELYIEREDFMEDPPRKFFRLSPGKEVRLRYAYYITCNEVIKNDEGEIIELRCTYDPETKGGNSPDGRKVKGTLHWVSASESIKAEIRLYDRLFEVENPSATKDQDFREFLNPNSLQVLEACFVEPFLKNGEPLEHFQFERKGYFNIDKDSTPDHLVINRTVTLRDNWAKKMNNK
ncbi:MAG: glutamine--tRNA ligase/YqeY domain fusion protein [Prolixibacteraceae bacterium]|jgi:glutaminyl-tRNA synthetase|nr:glutamine--tRNA ligase/YqeY domain fusion protein [Prolixibacteraceae bacterium]